MTKRFVIVTGGAGFIGSNVVAALEQGGTDVVVADRLRDNDKWRNLAKRRLLDIVVPEKLGEFLNASHGQVESVVHMGAISATTAKDGDAVVATNFTLSRMLWEWCAAEEIPFIYASSAATYGDGVNGFTDDWSSHALAMLRPLNLYGWSKQLFDRWVANRVEKRGSQPPCWAGLKFFNVYGPNEYHKGEMRSVVAKLYPVVRAGAPATLFKSHRPDVIDGGQQRDFVCVDDCVSVVRWFLDRRGDNGIFNVGTGRARSFADLAKAVMEAIGVEPAIRFIPMPEEIRSRYQYFTEASLQRLRATGYEAPFSSIEDGVRRYVQEFLNNDDPYR